MDRRILAIALFVSLALNVFIVGAFVGARLSRGRAVPDAPPPAAGQRNPIVAAIMTLPPAEQDAWRDQMPSFAQEFGPKMRHARQLTRQTMLGLGQDPLDADAALAALKQARALEQESREEMDRRLVAFAATLPPADRARLGAALARPPIRAPQGQP